MGQDVKLVSQWTNLVNAVAVEVPYGKLAEIQAMSGVQNAYVRHVYDRPIDETGILSEEGAHGYSYDLVGLNGAWQKGITGQGMLVAVLDTGLDLQWSAWGDSSDPPGGCSPDPSGFLRKPPSGMTPTMPKTAGQRGMITTRWPASLQSTQLQGSHRLRRPPYHL